MKKKIIHLPILLIAGFTLLLMVAILLTQYQSASIVKQLKTGNSQSIRTINVGNLLEEIINDVFTIEQDSKNYLITGNDSLYLSIQQAIDQLGKNKVLLKNTGSNSDSNRLLIDRFISLIDTKTAPILKIQGVPDHSAREAVSAYFSSESSKNISDSIYTSALAIQLKFEKDLESAILTNERLSGRVQSLARVLGLIAIGSIALLGTIIIMRFMRHFILISKLNQTNNELTIAKQQAEQASLVKEQFLSNMSHEIRTPVNSIIGFTRLLQKTPLRGEQVQYAGLINTAGENLLNIVNDILDISKIEAGMMHFDKNPFDIVELCYTVEMMFYHPVSEKKLHYESVIDSNVPEILIGDKERLNQVLTNLVSNAIKFTTEGGITLHISLKEGVGQQAVLVFSVTDTGIGINPEKLESIFERFEQEEASTTRNYGGTGLGLAIVKKMVTLQGGKVSVQSTVGKGSTFLVELPFTVSDNEDRGEKARFSTFKNICPVNENKSMSGLHLLVAEDNKMNQMLLSYIFGQWQLSYEFAENGEMAVRMLKEKPFDLVLMDIQMPVMDGYTATEMIRKQLNMDIPVVAMTANVLPGEKEKCRAFGMNDYISKPIHEHILYDMILKNIPSAKLKPGSSAIPHYIDKNYLDRIYRGNQEFIRKIIDQFIMQFPEELHQLADAVRQRDFAKATRLGHNMKTTVTSLHAESPLLEYLEAIESADNSASGWEIIQHKSEILAEKAEKIVQEAAAFS